jgi:hypothetical protein
MRELRRILYIALFLCAIWVSGMGYRQVMLAHSEDTPDLTTWLPKQEIERLMRYHGTDGMMITPDAAFILRNSKWIEVVKRNEVESGGSIRIPAKRASRTGGTGYLGSPPLGSPPRRS